MPGHVDTIENMVLDAGVLMLDYGLPTERILGLTAGGSTYEVIQAIRVIKADGQKGKTKGFRRITALDANIKTNIIEQSAANIKLIIAGSGASTPAIYTAMIGVEYQSLLW